MSEAQPAKVPTTKPTPTVDSEPDQMKQKHTDKINNEPKSKPSDKSVSERPHLNGDDAKQNGETKPGSDLSKTVPADTSNEKQDSHDTDTEEERSENLLRPRIQDRKGSIRELIPDKKHGFQLMLKVVVASLLCPQSSLLLEF